MKLAVGYQQTANPSLIDIIEKHAATVAEVYFAWPGEPSGRMPLGLDGAASAPEVQARLEADLAALRGMGIRLNLLFNASCYGEWAVSESLAARARALVGHLRERFGIGAVTTCSPLIAGVVKEFFPDIATRASVNMRIGTIQAAAQVGAWFDEYVFQRDYNRDLERLAAFKAWCDRNGKKVELLANSGCMAFCAGQTFHDNLVAHEAAASQILNTDFDPSLCRHVYLDPDNWAGILQSTWIRPEDLRRYEPYVAQVKLATRMHKNPARVIGAYAAGAFDGDLLDLFEPGLGPMLGGRRIENAGFPADWFDVTSTCRRTCQSCGYCARTLKTVLRQREPG
jgi:hypothetical protein